MLSLYRRFHAEDSPSDRFRTDDAEDSPLLDRRRASSARAEATTSRKAPRVFSPDHGEALRTLHAIAKGLLPSTSANDGRASSGPAAVEMLTPTFLSLLADLNELRYEAPRLSTRFDRMEEGRAIGRESVSLLAKLVGQKESFAEQILWALSTPHDGRAPCLLRLASGAVHDVPLSMAMCDLLAALARSRSVGPERLCESLLMLDSPEDARSRDALPEGMRSGKYTDFLGRLIGDGQGEWRNDGAIYAVGRLRDERLLPDRGQVVKQHSTMRWKKQEDFVRLCDALRVRPPWQHPAPPELSMAGLSGRIHALQDSLSTPRTDAHARSGAVCDQAVKECVDAALAQGWRLARERHEGLYLDQVSLPGAGLPAVGQGGALAQLCLPALGRLPKVPPARVADQVTAGVLRDEALRGPLARAASSGVSPACRELVAETARRHVEDVLDLSDRLAGFLPDSDMAAYRVRLTSDGDAR